MAIDPSEHTVDELQEQVKRIDDPDELRSILDAEGDGLDRKTARRAIESRLEKLGDGETTDESEDEQPVRSSRDKHLLEVAAEDAAGASERLDARLAATQ